MPGMSGRELAERLGQSRPDVKIVYMSGYTDDEFIRRGVTTSDLAFLEKPFTDESLCRRVRESLDGPRKRSSVLIADDDDAIRSLLRGWLESAGHLALEAGDGKDAVKQLATTLVDVVLIDLVMPEQEEIETIRTIRREHPDVKVIAMSGAFDGRYLKAAHRLGSHATLKKPFELACVLQLIEQVLREA